MNRFEKLLAVTSALLCLCTVSCKEKNTAPVEKNPQTSSAEAAAEESTKAATPAVGVAIDEKNFPDEGFREAVVRKWDISNDNILSDDEISKITQLIANGYNISDMTGIEHFSALKTLHCAKNNLTSLDVSKNTALEELYCHENEIASLDLSNNSALKMLECSVNLLASLDLSKNTAIETVISDYNPLTSLDVSNCTSLKILTCIETQLPSLDVSNCTALTALNCVGNPLTSLDLSQNPNLAKLDCDENVTIIK